MGTALAATVAGIVVLGAIAWWAAWLRPRIRMRRAGGARRVTPGPVRLGDLAVAVLDLDRAPADSPALERLVREKAAAVFASLPDVRAVEIRGPSGAMFGTMTREPPPGPGPVTVPVGRLHRAGPHPERHLGEEPSPMPEQHWDGDAPPPPPPHRPFAERYDLPSPVRSLLRDPDDPVDVVRAILAAAGYDPEVDGDTLVAGDHALVVLSPRDGVIAAEALGHAFLRVDSSRAAAGTVLMLGFADLEDVRHREVVAPHVRHAGGRAIQRMADAVALGADPLPFAVLAVSTPGAREHSIA